MTSCAFAGPLAARGDRQQRLTNAMELTAEEELDEIAAAKLTAARDATDGQAHEVASGCRGDWSVVATVVEQRGREGQQVRGLEQ